MKKEAEYNLKICKVKLILQLILWFKLKICVSSSMINLQLSAKKKMDRHVKK